MLYFVLHYYGHRPVDLLQPGPRRLIYAVIFGIMSSQFLVLVLLGGELADSTCNSASPFYNAGCGIGKYSHKLDDSFSTLMFSTKLIICTFFCSC